MNEAAGPNDLVNQYFQWLDDIKDKVGVNDGDGLLHSAGCVIEMGAAFLSRMRMRMMETESRVTVDWKGEAERERGHATTRDPIKQGRKAESKWKLKRRIEGKEEDAIDGHVVAKYEGEQKQNQRKEKHCALASSSK